MGLSDGGIPDGKLPQCWSDDVRMNALFAPFRLKAANPESWEMKMKFWSDMLRLWCRCRGDPVVSASDAKVAFQRNGRTPACIDIVVEEMFRNRDLVPLSKYQQILHNGPEGWVRWGARLAFKPAAIALTAVSSLLPGRHVLDNDGLPKASIDSTQKFVLESVLKEQATSLLETYPPGMERVGTIDELMSRCSWGAGRDAFELALGWLAETGGAVIRGDVVKLAEPNQKVTQITETDEALVKLATAETRLESDATRLSRDLASAEADAKAALALGNRVAAKNHLRRKHKASNRLDKCIAALDNVKHLLVQMRDVSQNKAIVDTYNAIHVMTSQNGVRLSMMLCLGEHYADLPPEPDETAADAMKRDMKENNMNEDAVLDTMDDLKEVMDTYNEIEKALSTTMDDETADLEAELKELLARPGDSGGNGNTAEIKSPTPKKAPRNLLEKEFIFDGEERILAELNELGVEDSSPPRQKVPVAVPVAEAEPWTEEKSTKEPPKPSKSWYPPSSEWNNNFAEIRQDDRLHPGQPLNIDFSTPPRLYKHEFQVPDHKMDSGVWLFNKDSNSNVDDLVGTEYCSSESPGKTGGNFQMAPGGERKKEPVATIKEPTTSVEATKKQPANEFDDLERRLKNLRGFNL